MRVDRGLLGWGVFLILLGGIPLAVSQGWIPSDLDWWQLWPLVLVGLGVSILLRWTRFAALGGLLVAAIFGIILGGLLAGGSSVGIGCGGSDYGTAFAERTGELTAAEALVDIDMGCGDLTVTTAEGTGWRLSGQSEGGQPPIVESSNADLSVRMAKPGGFGSFFEDKSRWDVTLPTQARLALTANVNAGSGTLDLAGATLDDLSSTLNAGDISIDLGAATVDRLSLTVNAGSASILLPDGSMTGSVTVNAGSIEMCNAADVALRLTTGDNITASYDYAEAGLQEVSDGVWESPGWAGASKRIELSTSANAGSITLDPEDGCK